MFGNLGTMPRPIDFVSTVWPATFHTGLSSVTNLIPAKSVQYIPVIPRSYTSVLDCTTQHSRTSEQLVRFSSFLLKWSADILAFFDEKINVQVSCVQSPTTKCNIHSGKISILPPPISFFPLYFANFHPLAPPPPWLGSGSAPSPLPEKVKFCAHVT